MNMVETDRIVSLVETVAGKVSTFDRQAVRCWLYKAVMGPRWDWIGREVGVPARMVPRIVGRGERCIERLVDSGRFSEPGLAAAFEAVLDDFDPEADPEV